MFNYGKERRRMENKFAVIAKQCRDDGRSEEYIEKIHRIWLDELNSDRRFYSHIGEYDTFTFSDGEETGEDRSPLLKEHAEKLSVQFGGITGKWFEDIDDPELFETVKTFPEKDIEFLNLLMIGYSQREISKIYGCSDAAISKKMKRLRKKFEKFCSKG